MAGIIPPDLQVPPGMDPTAFLLQLPAMRSVYIPAGADTTMTTSGPDQVWFVVVAVTCIAIPAFFLMLRVYTRLTIFKSLEIVDYFLFLAFPLNVVEIAMGYCMVRWGAGVHQWQVTLNQLFNQLYWANIAQVIYCPLSFVVKMAILLQYLRLFAHSRHTNKFMWYGSWTKIIVTFVAYTIFMFWTLFYCAPRRMIWFKLVKNGKCHQGTDIILLQGALNMASDIVILLLPMSTLWRLKMKLSKKLSITALFATGLLACIASIMRIVFALRMSASVSRADVSHNGLFIGLWTVAEVSLGFIVACSICLPKFVKSEGARFRNAICFSSAPNPFSRLSSKPDKSWLWSSTPRRSTHTHPPMDDAVGLQHIKAVDLESQQDVDDCHALPSPQPSAT